MTNQDDELDEQCTRTCEILRVWSTERVPSSLNGFVVWRWTLGRKGADGDGLRHRKRTPASMEHHSLERVSVEKEKGEGVRTDGNERGDRGGRLVIFKTEND